MLYSDVKYVTVVRNYLKLEERLVQYVKAYTVPFNKMSLKINCSKIKVQTANKP